MTKKKNEPVRGFKVTNPDYTCKGYKFEVGQTYEHTGKIELCNQGFHFCQQANDCFNYYSFRSDNRVFEVEALGNVLHGPDKSVTDKLRIVRELTWQEVLTVVNHGKDNTGYRNTGDSNTGDRNTGYRNTGDWNTGDRNTGDRNTGDRNTGDRNTGDRNTGDRNTGYSNTGDRNTGYRNTGYSNTGDRNTGDRNTGDWNTGYRNTGYSNTGDRNTGAFCTGEPATIKMFNKPSSWTEQDFLNSKACHLMRYCVDTKMWVPSHAMTEEEKAANPSHKTAEGYLKDIPFKEAFQNAWHNWDRDSRAAFTSLPNFDAEIFEQITGVKVALST